jgi:hypothetical protein
MISATPEFRIERPRHRSRQVHRSNGSVYGEPLLAIFVGDGIQIAATAAALLPSPAED